MSFATGPFYALPVRCSLVRCLPRSDFASSDWLRSIVSYDRLFVLKNGKIAEFGVPEDLWCRYGTDKSADNDPYNQISLASNRSCANDFLCNVPVVWWPIFSMLYGIPAPQHLVDRKELRSVGAFVQVPHVALVQTGAVFSDQFQ